MPEASPAPAQAKKIQAFPCPSCSATMVYDPESGGMKCPYCGSKQTIHGGEGEVQDHVRTHALDEFLNSQNGHLQTLSDKALQANCGSCGGTVVFVPPEVAGNCSFCGAAIVAEPKAADPLIAPDGVLPARVSKNAARTSVQQWLSTRWFAPNSLKKMAQQEGISGVYLPFWTYDADTNSTYVGERGEHYYETETYEETDSNGNRVTRTREVQHTRWYPASGRVSRNFQDVLIPATHAVNERRLNKLQPWNLNAVATYEPAYLAGFKAQRYQLELADGFGKAKDVMRIAIEHDVCQDIGGDEQRVLSVDTAYSNTAFRHLLLPVWIGAYRFQQKAYQVVVNAQTGEVQGERPYSAAKITLLILTILLLLLILLTLGRSSRNRSQAVPERPPVTMQAVRDYSPVPTNFPPASAKITAVKCVQDSAANL